MKHKRISKDDEGLSPLMEYILTFVFASLIFSVIMFMSNGMFIEGPRKTVCTVQFADIGNDITTRIVDTYLIAPKEGNISTAFDMPMTVAGKWYMVDINSSPNGWDKEVIVYSTYGYSRMKVTLNGVNSTIPISGSTSSQNPAHKISYDS